ncbi:hypothetical protein MKEN_00742800 [Mycena kentingensis (nom. inval.)]|nr:hypothetical protein MKEN_00742800 [Mycena kentingensis (nom. inval.)]
MNVHTKVPSAVLQEALPTFRRQLGPNELSYFLPSRAYGLNDMFTRIVFRAPPELVAPFRVQIAWAIVLLRHTLLASRAHMKPGDYQNAEFLYTPPSSTQAALESAGRSLHFHDGLPPNALLDRLLNGGRMLPPSSQAISRLDIARIARPARADGTHEYQLIFHTPHMISDALVTHRCINSIFELVGGERTDAELLRALDNEWSKRWARGRRAAENVLVPSAETRVGGFPSKLYEAGWKIVQKNLDSAAAGGQVFPRMPNKKTKDIRLLRIKFPQDQTAAIFARCKAQRVTFGNAVFALCNIAWMRLCAARPELAAANSPPTLMYTAISLRGALPGLPIAREGDDAPDLSLALGYHTVSLPVLKTTTTETALFWHRARSAQHQLRSYTHKPHLLRGRTLATALKRAATATAFAALDDGLPNAQPPSLGGPPALLGVSHSGDMGSTFRAARYPRIELLDCVGGSRKGPGGMLMSSRTFGGRLSVWLTWDASVRPEGVVEEYMRIWADAMHELVLGDKRLVGSAQEEDLVRGVRMGRKMERVQSRL